MGIAPAFVVFRSAPARSVRLTRFERLEARLKKF